MEQPSLFFLNRSAWWLPSSSVDGVYNESVLQGFVDFVDEAVYVEAARIFKRNMRVNHGSMARTGTARRGPGPNSDLRSDI